MTGTGRRRLVRPRRRRDGVMRSRRRRRCPRQRTRRPAHHDRRRRRGLPGAQKDARWRRRCPSPPRSRRRPFPGDRTLPAAGRCHNFTAKVKAILFSFACELWSILGAVRYSGLSRGGMMRRLLLVLFVIVFGSAGASAQDFRGGITGRVVDSSGGRMPGVSVTATNVATNVNSTTTTNSEGDYAILFLNPGTYSLAAELSGFKKVLRQNIEVRVGEKLGLDLTLE